MGKTLPSMDLAAKRFWRDNRRFADLFNAIFFHGKPVIDPELLMERDTEVSASVQEKARFEHVKKTEDVTKYYQGVELVILGIENQTAIHYAMPLRNRLYDDLDYLKELSALTKEKKKLSKLLAEDEFLSGMKKGDKVHMSLRIVIYYGEEPWDGPTRLSEMILIPEIFRPFFQDYEIPLVSIRDPKNADRPYKDEEVQKIMSLIPLVYQGRWEEIRKMDPEMKKESADLIAVATGNQDLHELADKTKKGGVVRMCTSLENLKKQYLEDGKTEGKAEGIAEGKAKGKAEGIAEEKILIAGNLKKQGFLSLEQISEATGVDISEIERL